MSHFYKLYTKNDSTQNPVVFLKNTLFESAHIVSFPIEYEHRMEEIPLDPPWPHCKMLRMSPVPAGYEKQIYVFAVQEGAQVPDIWGGGSRLLVSARAKAVLEQCDDFGHEFHEVEVRDQAGQRVDHHDYYLMSVRRFLQFDKLGGELARKDEIKLNSREEKMFPVIQNNPELAINIAALPLWRALGNEYVVYLNETVFVALKDAGISGLDFYSSYYGKPGEAITRVEFD